MKVKVMLDKKEYSYKPDNEVGLIKTRIKETEIEVSELAEKMGKGCTFFPAVLHGTKSCHWVEQQVFALDFDEGTTIDEQLELCKQLNIMPVFGYTTFSHSEQKHKFRIAFVCDEVITDFHKRNMLQVTLVNTFNKSDWTVNSKLDNFFVGCFSKLYRCFISKGRMNSYPIIPIYIIG